VTNYQGAASANQVSAIFVTIVGGRVNTMSVEHFVISSGCYDNFIGIDAQAVNIAGAHGNSIGLNLASSTFGGGINNSIAARSALAMIAGGLFNDSVDAEDAALSVA
jgi:hypothetical protein